MRTRYQTMENSSETDAEGNPFPDVMTFPIELFTFTQTDIEYDMSANDVQRPDLMMSTYYGVPEFDDIALWLSDVPFIYDADPGDTIILPRKRDMERFFTTFTE